MFEVNHHEHKHYLVCLNCKEMIPVEGCPLGEYEKVLNQKLGFDVTGHKFEIYGYCKNCQMPNSENKKEDL
jgi:Fur family ferric uptake transcriptional regulator